MPSCSLNARLEFPNWLAKAQNTSADWWQIYQDIEPFGMAKGTGWPINWLLGVMMWKIAGSSALLQPCWSPSNSTNASASPPLQGFYPWCFHRLEYYSPTLHSAQPLRLNFYFCSSRRPPLTDSIWLAHPIIQLHRALYSTFWNICGT